MAAVIVQSRVIVEPKKIKSVTVSIVSPSIYHEVMEPDAMILVFWMLSFKPAFSLSFHLQSRGSLILLRFLTQAWRHLPIWGPDVDLLSLFFHYFFFLSIAVYNVLIMPLQQSDFFFLYSLPLWFITGYWICWQFPVTAHPSVTEASEAPADERHSTPLSVF